MAVKPSHTQDTQVKGRVWGLVEGGFRGQVGGGVGSQLLGSEVNFWGKRVSFLRLIPSEFVSLLPRIFVVLLVIVVSHVMKASSVLRVLWVAMYPSCFTYAEPCTGPAVCLQHGATDI